LVFGFWFLADDHKWAGSWETNNQQP